MEQVCGLDPDPIPMPHGFLGFGDDTWMDQDYHGGAKDTCRSTENTCHPTEVGPGYLPFSVEYLSFYALGYLPF